MRICSPQVALSSEANSGGEVFDRELLRHLAAIGVDIDLILPKNHPYDRSVKRWYAHWAPLGRGFRWYVSNLIFPWLIRRVSKKTNFDLLRVHSLKFTGPAAIAARSLFSLPVPLVAHHHHLDLDSDRLTAAIERRVCRAVDLVITGSKFSRMQLVDQFGLDADRVEVVYYGVDPRFSPTEKDSRLLDRWNLRGKRVLLTLGGLKGRKNLTGLLEIFQEIRNRTKQDAVLVVAGQGPEWPKLRALSERLSVSNHVRFTGFIPEAEKVAVYNLADVYVSTSSMEGFGLAVAEAMACGKPCVVFNVGSLPEVVDHSGTGFVVPQNDSSQYVENILMILEDQGLAIRLGNAGPKRVEHLFQWDRSAKAVRELYRKAIDCYPIARQLTLNP